MQSKLRTDAEAIARGAVAGVLPDAAVRKALEHVTLGENIYLVAVGKAAWQMADAAIRYLRKPIAKGIVLTKYGHTLGPLPGITCLEAGHPVPDENSYHSTQQILDMTANLTAEDTVLFLLSGGGSALFEKPLISPEKLTQVTGLLLASGADIQSINTIRKRLSGVKAGRFAKHCGNARVEAIIISDVLGDRVDLIASGPAVGDPSTSAEALKIAARYGLEDPEILALLAIPTPKEVPNVHTQIIGNVRQLCRAASEIAAALGYEPIYLTDRLSCEASDAGRNLANILQAHRHTDRKLAFLSGGETVVHVRGTGLGGRNQELALAAAEILATLPNAAIISLGSDGTDGPTDAAGGYADAHTLRAMEEAGLDYKKTLENNDSYHALQTSGGLIFTGPTGTNVNDITIGLVIPE